MSTHTHTPLAVSLDAIQLVPFVSSDAASRMATAMKKKSMIEVASDSATSSSLPVPPLAPWRRFYSTYNLGNVILLIVLVLLLGAQQLTSTHHRLIVNAQADSINYPLLSETVPTWMLILLAMILPITIICIIALIHARYISRLHAKSELYYVLFGWCMSMVMTLLVTDFLKRVNGRPRPNFMALSGYNPVDGSYTSSSHDVANAYSSFPSGHSSSAFSGLGYLTLYLLRLCYPLDFRTRSHGQQYHTNQGWKCVLCLLPTLLAAYIASTRITDYWHNFDDCAAGSLLGFVLAYLMFHTHVCWWWQNRHDTHHDDEETNMKYTNKHGVTMHDIETGNANTDSSNSSNTSSTNTSSNMNSSSSIDSSPSLHPTDSIASQHTLRSFNSSFNLSPQPDAPLLDYKMTCSSPSPSPSP